jgi:hypothetical protein
MSQPEASPQRSHPCRLFGILARKAKVGVLLRRGPSKWVRLVKWNVEDDTFEFGQWFRGRIYERRCDLSPDGRLLIYFASKFTSKTLADEPSLKDRIQAWWTSDSSPLDDHYTYAWTAVSKPPWFTALALWPKGDCWHGGGLFIDDKTVMLNHPPFNARYHPNHPPTGLKVEPNRNAQGEDWPIYSRRLKRDDWKLRQSGRFRFSWTSGTTTQREEVFSRRSPCGSYDLFMVQTAVDFEAYGGPYVLVFYLRPAAGGDYIELGSATWADWDQRGRLVLARDGRLFVYEFGEEGVVAPHLLHDFNDDQPQRTESPPEARCWN